MNSIYFLIPTLIAVAISMMIVRAGAIALMMTGMSFEKAKFQSLSAFSGTGFTTREAELVVKNSRRRKIISILMVLGNGGVVAVIVTATSSFTKSSGVEIGLNTIVLLFGILLIFFIAKHSWIRTRWETFVHNRLSRMKIFEDETTVDELLHITEGYGVVRIQLLENSRFIGLTLSQINLELDQSFILGVEQGKVWFPAPLLTRKTEKDDYLVIYGKMEDIADHFGD